MSLQCFLFQSPDNKDIHDITACICITVCNSKIEIPHKNKIKFALADRTYIPVGSMTSFQRPRTISVILYMFADLLFFNGRENQSECSRNPEKSQRISQDEKHTALKFPPEFAGRAYTEARYYNKIQSYYSGSTSALHISYNFFYNTDSN
jgi:hypothetical protein